MSLKRSSDAVILHRFDAKARNSLRMNILSWIHPFASDSESDADGCTNFNERPASDTIYIKNDIFQCLPKEKKDTLDLIVNWRSSLQPTIF